MTGYLTYDAHSAHLDDMRIRAGRRRPEPSSEETGMHARQSIAIRRATADDRRLLERLAALDSAPLPAGDMLIAEVEGEPQVAFEIASGATIADPFRPTAHLVELLSLRAKAMRPEPALRRRWALRSAYRTA
jgi:hypothetical protein